MEYRRLGTSDLALSVVTFGAWAIGGPLDPLELGLWSVCCGPVESIVFLDE